MRIIVVCGAGASSTFVALRVRRAADARGLRVDARAAAEAGLAEALDGADVLLVGAHLGDRVDALRELAAAASVPLARPPRRRDRRGRRRCARSRPRRRRGSVVNDRRARAAVPSARVEGYGEGGNGSQRRRPESWWNAQFESDRPTACTHGPRNSSPKPPRHRGRLSPSAKSGGTPVNAASILGVISQGIDFGDEVTLVVDGGDEQRVLDELVELLSTDHDE